MASKNDRRLVIVESPTKARTLSNILGRNYTVKASLGHVRDLPKSRLGVTENDDFIPHYIIPKDKRAVVKEIQEAAQKASTVYLATDPDREGEAISWHLVEAASLKDIPHHRVAFHEITPQAVRQAFANPRQIDMQLVYAQQARRILDRLLGYKISPLLWQKIHRGLSAGRVQSVALRLIVEREREIDAFVPQEYWTIETELACSADPDDSATFRARLVGVGADKQKPEIGSEAEAQRIVADLEAAAYRVADVRKSEQRRRPSPPFITSTLQQEAWRRLRFTAKRTMVVAQQLYEGIKLGSDGEVGLITYMRTDSTQMAESAVAEARGYIKQKYGDEYVPAEPRSYRKKVKGAQEAHEAIRPTAIAREPDSVRRHLTPDQYRLYTLIWQRAVASQMADAIYDVTTVDIEATSPGATFFYALRATATAQRFAGFRRLYEEATDDESQQDDSSPLPDLTVGEALRLVRVLPERHFTEPPPRYSEATLVKALEEKGIGRPSTYAPIISTIQDRGYVERVDGRLRPKELGYVVNDLLTAHFPDIIDADFTAQMEEELDDIADGEKEWQRVVKDFYRPLMKALKGAEKASPLQEATDEICPECGRPLVVRWGRYGRFLACTGFPDCRYSRPLAAEEEQLQATDEKCPECDSPMVVKRGRYGPFLACSRYPECKGTRPILKKIGVRCPKCGTGELVERRARRRRVFYGCSNYPDCDFVVSNRPLPSPCPSCGGLVVAEKDEGGRCTRCDWRDEQAQREVVAAQT